jgi:hypothetical protein
MSTRFVSTLFTLSTTVFLAAGCAAGPEGEELEGVRAEQTDEDQAMPTVETDTIATEATGVNCSCPAGTELQGGLCYPRCAPGWYGEGPVCWKPCASGFKDTGWFCHHDAQIISADTRSCPWYNKCGVGSSCNKCPAGWINDGCTCRIDAYIYAQESYGRGAGTVPTCSSY